MGTEKRPSKILLSAPFTKKVAPHCSLAAPSPCLVPSESARGVSDALLSSPHVFDFGQESFWQEQGSSRMLTYADVC